MSGGEKIRITGALSIEGLMTNADSAGTAHVHKPRAGRPRSAESRRAIIQSAMHILQNDGYAALNIEAIAARAGVSKQTIYRWWPSAAFIVLEALTADMQSSVQESLVPDTGSLKGDLLDLVRPTVRALAQRRGPVFKALIAEAQADARFAEAFRTSLMAAHRETVRAIVGRAQLRGEVGFDADVELAADMIYGPILYRLLNGHAALDETFAYGLADATVVVLKAAQDQATRRAAEAAE
jgi:AcrR family transcriptional regulator